MYVCFFFRRNAYGKRDHLKWVIEGQCKFICFFKGVLEMKILLTIVLAVALMAVVAQAAPTAEDVEGTVETSLGLTAVTTYLELTKIGGGTGDTKDGRTLVTPTSQWGYPDGSDNNLTVNENSLDEDNWNHGGNAENFLATISGLTASTDYRLYVVALGRTDSTTEDFSWGTVADGSPLNVVSDVSAAPGAIQIGELDWGKADFAVPVGTFTSNVAGEISIWLGKAGAYSNETYRTQLDGIVVVPEPMTMTLLGLGGLALIRRKR
jgi:hypothetical protein